MNDRDQLFEGLDLFLRRLIGLVESEGLSVLADAELPITQVRTVMLLACAHDPLPIGAVADRLGLSVHAAGRNIDRLVDLGYVERRESPEDRRVKLVSLSAVGLDTVDQHLTARRRAMHTFIDRLTDDQVRAFTDVLTPLLAGDYLLPRQQGQR